MAELVLELVAESESSSEEDRKALLAFCLSDELVQFFYGALTKIMKDSEGASFILSLAARRAAARSRDSRRASSKKYKFLAWALEQNRRNPNLSKNAIAEKYARENPGVSVATLRRYLSSVPAER